MGYEPKEKQHYVPQTYLEGFTSDGHSIHVFDKWEKRSFASNKRDIAQGRFFYDFDPAHVKLGDAPQPVENYLAEVEEVYGRNLRLFTATVEQTGIRPIHKEAFAFFIMLQLMRTEEMRDRMISVFSQGSDEFGQFLDRVGFSQEVPDLSHMDQFDESKASLWQGALLTNLPTLNRMAEPLIDLDWTVGISPDEDACPFWTSDHPVVLLSSESEIPIEDILTAPGTEIRFPLSKRHNLFLRASQTIAAAADGTCVMLSEQDVMDMNGQHVVNCRRYVYSPNDDFSVAREVCRLHPTVCQESKDFFTAVKSQFDSQ